MFNAIAQALRPIGSAAPLCPMEAFNGEEMSRLFSFSMQSWRALKPHQQKSKPPFVKPLRDISKKLKRLY
jgi:hypothetical protein